MELRRRACLVVLAAGVAGPPAARAQPAETRDPGAPNPLAPIAPWVGGEWVATVAESGGRLARITRRYEWSFDRRLIVGRSYAEADGQRRQTRETVFFWNPLLGRIEFIDHIDRGGHGVGHLERRDGQLFMDVRIVGNPGHPDWRAWVDQSRDVQVLRVEAMRDGRWAELGRYEYRREP